ncbi:MAG TPA: hypothetical protein VK483_14205 [Chitinophagaceae bacterium]|nr:hypothetical protein [Chitinophagaceae bacterium]
MNVHSFTRTGTLGGTLTIILANITSADALKTIVLAALGAVVSFFVSYGLKRMMRKRK